MIQSTDLSGKLALDARDLNSLKGAAAQNSPEALKTVAKQFEALFMNMVMKSMRNATPQDGPFNSEQTKLYTSMLDQQISQNMANRGIGLADVLVRQLSNNRTVVPPEPEDSKGLPVNAVNPGIDVNNSKPLSMEGMLPSRQAQLAAFQEQMRMQNEDMASVLGVPADNLLSQPVLEAMQAAAASGGKTQAVPSVPDGRPAHVRNFADRLAQSAEEASRSTGIPAKFMLGQAALETGWGKREIRAADGSNSHNLFGIKAGPGWKGKTVTATTTEYINGVPQRRQEKFRAYDSYADSFRDYAKLLTNNPRYENVIANARDAASFAKGLQRAGYATDPQYAAKLTRIIKQTLSA